MVHKWFTKKGWQLILIGLVLFFVVGPIAFVYFQPRVGLVPNPPLSVIEEFKRIARMSVDSGIGVIGIVFLAVGLTYEIATVILEYKKKRRHAQLHAGSSNAIHLLSVILVGILLFSILYFVQLGPSESYTQIEFQTISKGTFSGHKKAAYYVIENEDEWADIWNQHVRFGLPPPPPLEVNFSDTTIIAVFMGEFNTGGYGIEIKNILDMNESVLVKVEKTYPGRRCIVTMAFTEPFHIVRVERIEKEIEFYTYEKTYECS